MFPFFQLFKITLYILHRLNLAREKLYSEKQKSNDDKVLSESEISDIKAKLRNAESEIIDLKVKLRNSELDLANTKGKLRDADVDNGDIKSKLKNTELKILHLEPKAALSDDFEKQILILKDEIRYLRSTNSVLATDNEVKEIIIKSRSSSPVISSAIRLSRALARSRSRSPVRAALRSSSAHRSRHLSPLAKDNATQVIRQESLISRFNDMYVRDRLDAMDILRVYSDDIENNQRIVFAAVQVRLVKIAFFFLVIIFQIGSIYCCEISFC